MLREAVNLIQRWLHDTMGARWRQRLPAPELFGPPVPANYRRLERVVLTDEVSRTLFEGFADHRRTSRGDEEIGWVLLGLRQDNEVLVQATLPAGTGRSASSVHVSFDSEAQALGSRVVRQKDKRLTIVGVVHTHPGSLRHPSDGDYQGDILWVGRLRGGEGVFGIGTADGDDALDGLKAHGRPSVGFANPKPHGEVLRTMGVEPHMHTQADLRYSWYSLGKGDRRYRRLPVHMTLGSDLARSLHPIWPTMEIHARCLDRLYRQLTGVTLEKAEGAAGPVLAMNLKLAEPGHNLRILLDRESVQYYINQNGNLASVNPGEAEVERAVYKILAELAKAH